MSAETAWVQPVLERLTMRIVKLLGAFLVLLGLLPAAAAASNSLATYGTLGSGQSIVSPDGHYELMMQSDGNLVESIVGGRALWQSDTGGDTGSHAVMQPGGNLAIYNPAGAAVWSSNSRGTGCPQLVIQDDGNVVIYSPRAIWSTATVQTRMEPGDVLHPGWSIYSPSEQLQLIMQDDGNLVLYDGAGKALWASGTDHYFGAYATMQTVGNFVVYPPADTPCGPATPTTTPAPFFPCRATATWSSTKAPRRCGRARPTARNPEGRWDRNHRRRSPPVRRPRPLRRPSPS